jgi:cytochrome bd-type quinol oxidase subunit 2
MFQTIAFFFNPLFTFYQQRAGTGHITIVNSAYFASDQKIVCCFVLHVLFILLTSFGFSLTFFAEKKNDGKGQKNFMRK